MNEYYKGMIEDVINNYDIEENSSLEELIITFKYLCNENNQLKLINKEHQQINGELRQANKLLNEQYIRLYKEYEQQERIKYLERSNNRREDTILEQRQKICDLEDNWNKLKEDLELVVDYGSGDEASDWDKMYGECAKATLKYMKELEQGSDRDE